MATVSGKYRRSKEYLLVYAELIQAARYRGTVIYQEVASIMGLPLVGSYMGSEVGQVLGEISDDEHIQNRAMRSAAAVGARGSPGSGFFSLAKVLGKVQGDSKEGKHRF